MPTLQDVKIYYIQVGDKKYYGSTIQTLAQRKLTHKQSFIRCPHITLYRAIREANISIDDIELVLVENFPCETKRQRYDREKSYIQKDGELNERMKNEPKIPSRTQTYTPRYYTRTTPMTDEERVKDREACKRWYNTHKETKSEKNKKYREANKEKMAALMKKSVSVAPSTRNRWTTIDGDTSS